MTAAQKNTVKRMTTNGKSAQFISKKTGLSVSTIYEMRRQYGWVNKKSQASGRKRGTSKKTTANPTVTSGWVSPSKFINPSKATVKISGTANDFVFTVDGPTAKSVVNFLMNTNA